MDDVEELNINDDLEQSLNDLIELITEQQELYNQQLNLISDSLQEIKEPETDNELNENLNTLVDLLQNREKKESEKEAAEKEKMELQQAEQDEIDKQLEEQELTTTEEQKTYEENILDLFTSMDDSLTDINATNEIVEQNLMTLDESVNTSQVTNVEGFWLLAIVITLAMGFKLFFDNVLKW